MEGVHVSANFGKSPILPTIMRDKLKALNGATSESASVHFNAIYSDRKVFSEVIYNEKIRKTQNEVTGRDLQLRRSSLL